jgi:hypothetical protein
MNVSVMTLKMEEHHPTDILGIIMKKQANFSWLIMTRTQIQDIQVEEPFGAVVVKIGNYLKLNI